jgi:hypothetical protein
MSLFAFAAGRPAGEVRRIKLNFALDDRYTVISDTVKHVSDDIE